MWPVAISEVHLTVNIMFLTNEQLHTDQSNQRYDTYLLEKVDRNTTHDSTNMCHRGREIDQDVQQYKVKSPLLNAELVKSKEMIEKETYNELSRRFLLLEISIQQKEESFQSNKPCKNQDAPEFREFFEINDLKAQLQAKTTLICNLKNQIKSVKRNEAKVKNDIDSVENADLKAQIQEKVFVNASLKNELRKLKGNSVDTKFAKASILGKPPLQPSRNHSVVLDNRNAFKVLKRPKFSKQRKLEKDTKKEIENSKPSVMPSVDLQNTANGHSFSQKTSAVYEKTSPRSCLRWKPTGKIFTIVSLKWIPTGMLFDSCTSKVDNKPPNGSNDDVTNPYECNQTLNISAGTLNLSAEMVIMAPVQLSTGPTLTFLTPGQISSGLVLNSVPAAPFVPPTNKELEILFQPMFDEYIEPPRVERQVSPAPAVSVPVNSAGTPSSTTIDQYAPSPSHSPSSSAFQSPSLHTGIATDSTLMEDNPFAPVDNHPFINVFPPEPSSEASSSGDLRSSKSPFVSQTLHHLWKWSKDHPLDNIIGNPSRPVSTRKQLETDALWCLYNYVLS
ncbi:hypothetical protein Tco_0475294, partial [Tanacetum coccineum]